MQTYIPLLASNIAGTHSFAESSSKFQRKKENQKIAGVEVMPELPATECKHRSRD